MCVYVYIYTYIYICTPNTYMYIYIYIYIYMCGPLNVINQTFRGPNQIVCLGAFSTAIGSSRMWCLRMWCLIIIVVSPYIVVI